MNFLKILSLMLSVVFVMVTLPVRPVGAIAPEELSAPAAVLMDAETGTVLFEKNSHEVRACASITKVMTLILVMEALDSGKIQWDDTVTASAHAASMGGSDIWLEPGETMSVEEMVKATIVASANDAAVALAELVSGTEKDFVRAMNEKAKELHMKETVFKNCNGLDEEGHVTSAYDVAVMSAELLRHPKILQYSGIWMDELRGGKTQLVNTNKLLKSYPGITGLKTGTTSKAGSCISATADRDGLRLIAVVLGSSTGKERFSDAAKLLDYGYANYTMLLPEVPPEVFRDIPVKNGMTSSVATTCQITDKLLAGKGRGKSMEPEIYLPETVEAPIEKGEIIGKLIYKSGGKQIAEYPIAAEASVEAINFNDVMGLFLRSMAG
ncbi:MAG: D-alanyl-D-alanine carboxypeptidase family protein [Acutalibacteraceae bacterium]|nr:D-alanyl-D-alanine carboxypeptidase family protein [Acutalibacteraceae bacterium]